ncbi:MAG: ribonuclease HII [Bifidobacterium sp.]|nr:ribonuclease HII [Bifidobacterium sp.]
MGVEPMNPGVMGEAPVTIAATNEVATNAAVRLRGARLEQPPRRAASGRGPAARICPTLDLEDDLAGQGFDLIVGFDEVGRGALAGPVMVGAAAIWAADVPACGIPLHLADSKMLTAHMRESLFEPLHAWCAADAVGQASNTEIDEWGISHALGVAALRALNHLERQLGLQPPSRKPSAMPQMPDGENEQAAHRERIRQPHIGAILDGPNDYISKALDTFDAPALPCPAHVVTRIKADQLCATVAAASVLAKVTRDRLMISIAQGNPLYQPYQWAANKGYGTAVHRAAIAEYGATDLHRRTWHLA